MGNDGNTTITTVLVGVDRSDTALAAARNAADLARQLDATLHIVTAYGSDRTTHGGTGSDSWTATSVDFAEQTLGDVASRVGQGVEITSAAASGKPADVIIAEAARIGADVIVVGSKRMTGLKRVLGSVANDVAHHAPCNVFIAKTAD